MSKSASLYKRYRIPPEIIQYAVFLQKRRNGAAAKRFFNRLLKVHRKEPRKIVTDRLRSYGVAHQELIRESIHDTFRYANNRAELSHQATSLDYS